MSEPADPMLDKNSFAGARFQSVAMRMIRSYEHAKTLKAELGEIDGQTPTTTGDVEGDPPYYSVRLSSVPVVHPYVGAVIGDIVHEIRAGLDNLVWQLVKMGYDPNPAKPRLVEFPFYGSPTEFWADPRTRMPGIPHPDRAILERYQPYQGGYPPGKHPFAVLDDLWNEDKHRTVLPVALPVVDHKLLKVEALEGRVVRIEDTIPSGVPLEVGAEVCRVFTDPPGRKVRVHGHLGMAIEIEHRGRWGDVIGGVSKEATQLFKEFFNKYP
jgi:hypothetical protein